MSYNKILERLNRHKEIKNKLEEFGRGWAKMNGWSYDDMKYKKNYTKPLNHIKREIKKLEKELKQLEQLEIKGIIDALEDSIKLPYKWVRHKETKEIIELLKGGLK